MDTSHEDESIQIALSVCMAVRVQALVLHETFDICF
jgi:hypothetical protein